MKKTSIIFLAVLLSCSSGKKLPADWWKGMTRLDLIQRFGFPQKEESDHQGGSIILFSQTRKGLKSISPPESYYYYLKTYFFLDSTGHAYSMSKGKDLIPPSQTDLSIFIK